MAEPILDASLAQTGYFPIRYSEVKRWVEKHRSAFWLPAEIRLADDLNDWNNKLSDAERNVIKFVLAFFAASDSIIMKNVNNNFAKEVSDATIQSFYAIQTFIEDIHSETYSLMIQTYGIDDAERTRLFNAVESIASVALKRSWAETNFDAKRFGFAHRLISMALVEGIFFASSFAIIYYFRSRGLLTSGLSVANDFIARDETMHRDFGCYVYRDLIRNKLPVADVQELIRSAVTCEQEFVAETLPVALLGLDVKKMCRYVEFIADQIAVLLGVPPVYGVTNSPFDFTNLLVLQNKTNFFEHTVTEYNKAASNNQAFEAVEDF